MTKDNTMSWFENLRQLLSECGPNRNHKAIVAITACISERIDTAKAIFEVAARLGLNTRHVAIILRAERGTNPARHRWRREESGRYRLLD